ncbi:hypothetical protein ACFLR8_01535 [Bacteroidota bacterium]
MSNPIDLVNKRKGSEWPSQYTYDYNQSKEILILELQTNKKGLVKGIDAWAIAVKSFLNEMNAEVKEIRIDLQLDKKMKPDVELLRRRVSYLSLNNDLSISLHHNGKVLTNDALVDILSRGEDEVVRTKFKKRDSKDKSTGLEKILQNYLFDTGDVRTNERLAIFGKDFIDLKKKEFGIEREFPTGVFNTKISRISRILPTEFIDFVTVNKYNQLAIIELKINDPNLQVISQSLNYFLFFTSYFDTLKPALEKRLNIRLTERRFKGYIVTNILHPKFNSIFRYYQSRKTEFPFEIVPTILGYYLDSKDES